MPIRHQSASCLDIKAQNSRMEELTSVLSVMGVKNNPFRSLVIPFNIAHTKLNGLGALLIIKRKKCTENNNVKCSFLG